MRNIIIFLIVGLVAWKGYVRFKSHGVAISTEQQEIPVMNELKAGRGLRGGISSAEGVSAVGGSHKAEIPYSISYRCDGRIYCSQMTSFEEAMYFLKNCPGVKMDGDNDGVPCELRFNK